MARVWEVCVIPSNSNITDSMLKGGRSVLFKIMFPWRTRMRHLCSKTFYVHHQYNIIFYNFVIISHVLCL